MVENTPRVSLNLRVAPDLKHRVESFAQELGISLNAASAVLLAAGLRAEQKRSAR